MRSRTRWTRTVVYFARSYAYILEERTGLCMTRTVCCGSKSTAVFGTTAPKPSTNLRELILTFIQPQKSVLGGSSFQVRDRSGVSPGPKRKQSVLREDFARSHQDVLVCMVFFTTKVLTLETANGGKTKNRIRPVRDDSKACEIDSV